MGKLKRSIIENWDTEKVIWTANPQLKLVFKDVWSKDSSIGKKVSSKMLWTVAYIYDSNSTFKGIPNAVEIVEKSYSGVGYWAKNEKELTLLSERWLEMIKTPASYLLQEWYRRLKRRDDFLREQEYTFGEVDERSGKLVGGTAVSLDKMEADTQKLWNSYFAVEAALEKEDHEGNAYGGGLESASDTGEI